MNACAEREGGTFVPSPAPRSTARLPPGALPHSCPCLSFQGFSPATHTVGKPSFKLSPHLPLSESFWFFFLLSSGSFPTILLARILLLFSASFPSTSPPCLNLPITIQCYTRFGVWGWVEEKQRRIRTHLAGERLTHCSPLTVSSSLRGTKPLASENAAIPGPSSLVVNCRQACCNPTLSVCVLLFTY